MDKFIQGLLTVDRRWIYLALATVLVVSLLTGKVLNPVVMPPVQQFFNEVEQAPAGPEQDKIVLVAFDFEAGSLGENGNQARVLLRHLMLRHKKFAIYSVTPQGATNARKIASDVAEQYGYRYGIDWIDFGYINLPFAFYKAIISDFSAVVPTDAKEKKEISSFPVTKNVKSIKDVSLFVEITAYGVLDDVIAVVQPATKPRLKIAYACTGINVTGAYPYLDSGQLIGMMPGLKGAADYEKLVDELEDQEFQSGNLTKKFDYKAPYTFRLPDSARQLMFTQGAAHLVVLLFILVGNIGLILTRLRGRSREKKEAA